MYDKWAAKSHNILSLVYLYKNSVSITCVFFYKSLNIETHRKIVTPDTTENNKSCYNVNKVFVYVQFDSHVIVNKIMNHIIFIHSCVKGVKIKNE